MGATQANVKNIFGQVKGLSSSDERAAYLQQACAGEPALRAEIESLLQADHDAGSFLRERNLFPTATVDEPITERPGAAIGPYKLLEQIGEGGFGVVFMAEQTHPVRRKVALKVIKPGMDTRQVIARFEAERQALALMDHPNIARVLDAGTTGEPAALAAGAHPPPAYAGGSPGRPYFVMELVRGPAMTDYCDQNSLPIRERLELFIDVCHAVQHAHQKGIIHRDIKPSNVLVTLHDGMPVVKVIDFGIAKALGQQLTDKTLFTNFAQMIGTPLYMSPEQAEWSGLDVDTRSDIYSLGVLLYELLTGTTPFDKERLQQASFDEIRRIIREEEPPKPSTRMSQQVGRFSKPSHDQAGTPMSEQVGRFSKPSHDTAGPTAQAATTAAEKRRSDPRKLSRLFRGELDWIVMKALEKDRNRRYETASAFAADVGRYLKDEPVQACPPSAWYKLRKLARRKKTALAMAACVFLALAGIAGSVGWAVRDRVARDHDQAAREEALDKEVERLLDEARPLIDQGKWPEALAVVERADKLLASAGRSERPQRLLELRKDLSMAQRLEDIYREPKRDLMAPMLIAGGQGIEHSSLAQPVSAEEEFFSGRQQDARFPTAFQEFGIDLEALEPAEAAARIKRTSVSQALVQALDGWAVMRKRSRGGEEDPFWKKLVEIARQADPDQWRNQFRDALLGRDRPALEKLAEAVPIRDVPPATAYLLGLALKDLGALDKAMDVLREAHRHHPDDFWLNDALAWFSKEVHPPRYDDALRYYTAALAVRPQSVPAHRLVAETLQVKGALDEAIAEYSRVIELTPKGAGAWNTRGAAYWHMHLYDKALADFNQSIELAPKASAGWHWRGLAYVQLHQYDKAIGDYNQAIELGPKVGNAWGARAQAYMQLHQYEKAIADYSKEIELDPKNAAAWHNRGSVYNELHQYDKALADFSRAIELDPKEAAAWAFRGSAYAYIQMQQWDMAIADLNKAIALNPKLVVAWNDRGMSYRALGQWDKAVADFSQAIELDPKNAVPWSNRGGAYNHMGQYDKALADCSKAIELDPKHAIAWNYRGRVYYNLGQYDKALADFSKAIELDPKAATCWTNRGYCYNALHEPKKALSDLNEALKLDPKSARFWGGRGEVYLGLRQFDKAVADFNKAIELDPKSHQDWCNRGAAYNGLHQYDKALADLNKAVESDAKCPQAWSKRGAAYNGLNQYDKALADLNKAIDLDPKNAAAWNHRGWAYTQLHQYDKALADLNKAIELDPKNAVPWYNRSSAYNQLHEYDKELSDLNKAIELDPKNAVAWYNRGSTYIGLHQYDKALADYSKVIELEPKNAVAWNQRGVAYYSLHQCDKALADYTTALELQPDSAVSAVFQQNLAWVLATCPDSKLRDPKRAVELAQKAVKAGPKEGNFWTTLGAARYRTGDWKGAAAALLEAEKLLQSQGGFQ
jgi:tetratricopeptide (TPR) repeat protein